MDNFDQILAKVRKHATANFESRYQPSLRADFEVERKAMVVAFALDYLAARIPEAHQLVGEVHDLVMQLRDAKEMTPMVRHFL